MFVGVTARDAQQIFEIFVLRIRVGEHVGRRVVHAADVARVPAVAAAKIFRRALEQQHARSRQRAAVDRRAKRRVAAADNEDVFQR